MTTAAVWCIAGTDGSGSAGLAADQRAVESFPGAHFCGIVAGVTAPHAHTVARSAPLDAALIDAQLAALEDELPPAALKTGWLGSTEQVRCVARWVDRLRARNPRLPLVVDPVLADCSGAAFADAEALAAFRAELLPRATLITPNRREAAALLGAHASGCAGMPALAQALRQRGTQAVCVTGGDADDGALALDWVASEHADGWLALPRIATRNTHGSGCTFASSAAAALALGHVPADAAVLAKMAAAQALASGQAAGSGPGPVGTAAGFFAAAALLPRMSFDAAPDFVPQRAASAASAAAPLGLYAIVDSAARAQAALRAGVRTLQLRIKIPADADAHAQAALRRAVHEAAQACRAAGARLFVNDHWRLAIECAAHGVHLGQEDLLALGAAGRAQLAASGLALGVSSHSLWELARARGLAPDYVACGPVWPTLTKAMPWRPQGLDNLRWWRAMAGAPVVAIGGILTLERLSGAARCGVDGVCVVRMLGDDPAATVPAMQAAIARAAMHGGAFVPPGMPHPTLDR